MEEEGGADTGWERKIAAAQEFWRKGGEGDPWEGHQETRRCSQLNRGTSTQRRHDKHPDLHMHRKLKQGSTHLDTYTHTHTHTRVRAWHGAGTTGDAPRHMHTRLDRQAAGSVSTGSPSRCLHEGGARAWSCLPWGCASGSSGPPRWAGVGPWRETFSAAQHWQHSASPGHSQATRHHSWLYTRCTRFGGASHSNQFDCGTEFSTPFSLRVSMPLGGKYKRCLCLKPNVGVSGSPGLCPSFGPELLATEGWAETRGRPPSYAQHGSSV